MGEPAVVVELGRGRSGELVLLRRGDELQLVCNGAFVIASCNERSSRALVAAARPFLPAGPLDVLIGGLGMGYALDEALDLPGLVSVTVAEYEPLIVTWYARTCASGRRAPSAMPAPASSWPMWPTCCPAGAATTSSPSTPTTVRSG